MYIFTNVTRGPTFFSSLTMQTSSLLSLLVAKIGFLLLFFYTSNRASSFSLTDWSPTADTTAAVHLQHSLRLSTWV